MHQSFMEAASKVDTNGIFVFYFTGHGLKIRAGKGSQSDEWGLAPMDFDCTRNTFITAAVLVSWLQYVRFQGRYAFFILDCCYASGIGEKLVIDAVEAEIPVPGLFVLTACTALESSLVLPILEHSIFNFFLGHCLFNSYYCQRGRLPIKKVYEECQKCCLALSSLLIGYDSKLKLLKWNMMQPEMKYFNLTEFVESLLSESDSTEQTDSGLPNRFQFALEYYKSGTKKSVIIPDKCQAWLEIVSQPNGPLDELHKRQFIEGKMLTAIVASMMYSMASFFVARQQPDMSSSNTFIVSFLHVVAAIDRVHGSVSFTLTDLKICLEFYATALDKHKISPGDLRRLYNVICRDISKRSDSSEGTDSGASPQKVSSVNTPINFVSHPLIVDQFYDMPFE